MANINLESETITPSEVITTEERTISGFIGIEMSTFGQVVLTQGGCESLTIKGSDNIAPITKTQVRNGVLSIETDKNINIAGVKKYNISTFTLTVKDLTSLMISGAGKVEMAALSTSGLEITISGPGQLHLNQLSAERVNINSLGSK